MLKVYQFTLPDATNAGESYAGARLVWENEALRIAGGFTKTGEVEGAWLNDAGRPQWERNHLYQVALDTPDKHAALLNATRKAFPDQQAFYVAAIGTAEMVDGRGATPPHHGADWRTDWKPLPPLAYDPGADGRDAEIIREIKRTI